MKVEILNIDASGCKGFNIYADNIMLSKPTVGMNPREWSEDEIESLLGQSLYKKIENGQFTFTLPTWKIRLIEGKKAAKTREQLLFISQFSN